MAREIDYQLETVVAFTFLVAPDTRVDLNSHELLNRLFHETEKKFLLRGSGFNMDNQIQKWINGFIEASLNNESFEETRKRLVDQLISDVSGFYFEYISDHDIFPFDLEITENKTVYATKYRETLENITRSNEREGALLEGINVSIEMIVNSPPNTVIFLTSPAGWSGLGHNHPDTQTYVYWIDKDGNLKAMTLKTNMTLNDNEKLVGTEIINQNHEHERIKDVVSSPIKMKVVDDGFLEVLDRIESRTGKQFKQLRHQIIHRDIYNSLTSEENKEVGIIIENLRSFIIDNIYDLSEDNIKRLAYETGRAILDMKDAVNKRKIKFDKATIKIGYDSPEVKYSMLAHEVRQLRGCNGGQDVFGVTHDHIGLLKFRCHECNEINERPFGGYLTECKYCHVKFDKCVPN